MPRDVRFGLLGPLRAEIDGEDRVPTAPRQRALLAVLLIAGRDPLTAEQLLDRLWGESPPSGGAKTVGFHVSKLRDALEPDRPRGSEGSLVLTTPAGYVLAGQGVEVDANRFEALLADARSHVGTNPARSAELAREAIALWRGPALADFRYESFAQDEIRRLEELRMLATETRLESDLALGLHRELIPELEQLRAEHPLREGLSALLMVALYRAGRQADALRIYGDLRAGLVNELGIEPSTRLQDLELRILEQDADLLMGDGETRTGVRSDAPNPFKGLRRFREDEAADFHGRTALVERVLERFAETRLVALVGSSGSGKSSVAMAGVTPRLRFSHRIVEMIPGEHPLDELELNLLRAAPEAPASMVEVLRADADGLRRAVRLLPDGERVLLVVDQLEELWTMTSAEERDEFLGRVFTALDDDRTPLDVLVTLRADFLGEAIAHPGLAAALDVGSVLVQPLAPEEIEQAITVPAARVGVTVDPALVAAVVADIAEHPQALPLMQYALTEAFDQRKSDELTFADYARVGGLAAALGKRADAVFEELDESGRSIARDVFLRLVVPGQGTGDSRRRAHLEELGALGPAVDDVVSVFGAARLLTLDADPQGAATVEIAHEALITEWGQLAQWITEARDELVTSRRLADLAAEWEREGRPEGLLLQGGRLDRYRMFGEATSLALSQPERELLAASSEAELNARQRVRRRRVGVLAALTSIAVIAVVAALAAFANGQRIEEAARESLARAIAASALDVLDTDPELALLLAVEAAERSESLETAGVLQRVLDSQDTLYEFRAASGVFDVTKGLNQETPFEFLVTLEDFGAVRVSRMSTGELEFVDLMADTAVTTDPTNPLRTWRVHVPDSGPFPFAVSSPFGEVVVRGTQGLLRLQVGAERPTVSEGVALAIHDGSLFSALGSCIPEPRAAPAMCVTRAQSAFVPEEGAVGLPVEEVIGVFDEPVGVTSLAVVGDRVLVGTTEGLLAVPVEGGELSRVDARQNPDLYGAIVATDRRGNFAYTPDNLTLVIRNGEASIERTTADPISAIGYSADGARIAVGTEVGTVLVLDATSGALLDRVIPHLERVHHVGLNGNGSIVVSSTADGSIAGHALTGGAGAGLRLEGTSRSTPVGVSTGTNRAAAVYRDPGRITLLSGLPDGPSEATSTVYSGDFSAVAIDPTGERMAIGTRDGRLLVGPADTGDDALAGFDEYQLVDGLITGLALSPDGRVAASVLGVPIVFGLGTEVGVLTPGERAVDEVLYGTSDIAGYDAPAFAWSQDGEHLAIGGTSSRIVVYSFGSDEKREIDLGVPVRRLAFTVDGQRVMGLSASGELLAVDRVSGGVLSRSRAHSGEAVISIDPAGRWVATGGFDGAIRLWDQATGEGLATLRGSGEPAVQMLLVAGDYIHFVDAVGDQGMVTTDLAALVEEARSVLPSDRQLTPIECVTYLGEGEC